MWPKPIYFDPTWEFEPNASEAASFDSLLSDGRLTDRDQWNIPLKVIANRAIRYPFYKSGFSVELIVELPFEEGRAVGAWFVQEGAPTADPKVANGPVDKDRNDQVVGHSIYFLNGTSPPIHEMNAKIPVHLPDEEAAAAYLTFFCSHVWSDDGGFWILASAQDLPFLDSADMSSRDDILSSIKPTEFLGRNEQGFFLFESWVCYAQTLFLAQFAVQPTGMIEMLNDEPKTETLDLTEDRRVSGLRLLETASRS